tara:strand:- start:1084 stop:1203 length:120 start_codon:yes stop_codon:yes gene_type:complete
MQAVALQAVEDAVGGARFLAGRVKVFHADQPTASAVTSV